MGSEGVRAAEPGPENFMYLPWADVDRQTSRRLPVPPARYDAEISNAYKSTCGGNNLPANIYAAYAGSFRDGPFRKGAWGRRMSYARDALGGNGAQWAQADFTTWLDGGRRCEEGSPGYNRFVLTQRAFAGVSSSVSRHVQESMRLATQSMLDTRLFHYSRRRNRILFDGSVLNMHQEKGWLTSDRRLRNRLADRGGFEELMSRNSYGFYRNREGDDLVLGDNYILWGTFSPAVSFAAQFVKGEDNRQTVSGQALVIRNGQGIWHPVVEHAGDVLAYLRELETRETPISEKPLSLSEVLGRYGYLYLGNGSGKKAGETFKRAAMTYESVGRIWSMDEIGVSGGVAITNRLWYRAAEQYYLASAVYVAMGEFSSAGGMLHDMTRCLIMAGIEYSDKVQKIETAVAKLGSNHNGRNSAPPRAGGGQAVAGGSSVTGLAETGETSSGAASGASPYSRALPVTPQGRLARAAGFFISRSRVMAQYRAPRHAWLSGAILFNPKLALAR